MRKRAVKHPRSVAIPYTRDFENGDADAMPDAPFAEGAQDAMDPDLRHRLISEAAFQLYSERGFTDGYDLDDWLQAEAEVDHLLVSRRE